MVQSKITPPPPGADSSPHYLRSERSQCCTFLKDSLLYIHPLLDQPTKYNVCFLKHFCPKICSVLPDGHKDCRLLTPHSHRKEHDIWMSVHLFPTELDILVICPSCQWLTSLFCSPTDGILCRLNFWSFNAQTRAITATGKTKVTS